MTELVSVTELSAFSSPNATLTEWSQARDELAGAEVYWLSTVRPDGRPHVTPLLAIWLEVALYFCTGSDERKAKNLSKNRQCVLTTGHSTLDGLDLVIEGTAENVSDHAELGRVADTFDRSTDAFRRTGWNVVRSGGRHPTSRGSGLSGTARDRLWIWQRSKVQPNTLELLGSP
jgi:nitroimidazol reductase NimA-like FMN-containing flavoprotein (pyridoxamine 5'-phosphate oxidase superfamily)